MEFSSKLIQKAVEELSRLPGIGKKTALRLALHVLKQTEQDAVNLGQAIVSLRKDVQYCGECGNISDSNMCGICTSHRRDKSVICVVEDCKDVIAIENTNQYNGTYHVLGGLINPLQGVGPGELNIDRLITRAGNVECKEIVFAFGANLEGDTTSFYITRKLKEIPVRITSIARGIPVGADLEYTDEITLARSILNRTQLQLAPEIQSR